VTTSVLPRPTNGNAMDLAATQPSDADRWLVRHLPRPLARTRLYCFPWSGAGSSAYRGWAAEMPDDVELISIALPGRGARVDEALVDRIEPMADAIATAIVAQPLGDFAFFGHSFGALLAHAVTARLRGTGRSPRVLIVSASRPPWAPPPIVLHRLSDEALLNMLVQLGGLTGGHAADSVFRERFLPLVRADLRACETYRSTDLGPVDCRIRAWAATDDWYATQRLVRRWRRFAGADFSMRLHRGHHFSLREDAQTIPVLLKVLGVRDALPTAARVETSMA
jgi:surfactin synthase thioesterase subunit